MKIDAYQIVTDRIIAEMEKGIIPWQKPWVAAGGCISHETGRPYSLLNQVLLGKPGEWVTFNQAQKEGGHIRKGEKGKINVFWTFLSKEDKDTGEVKQIPYLKYNTVFHLDQCEGIKPKFDTAKMPNVAKPDEKAEGIVAEYLKDGVELNKVKGDKACYNPVFDKVTIPLMEQFVSTGEYYSALFHELVHSTGHESRLNRELSCLFGSHSYSKEELIAEIGSAILVNICGLETEGTLRNSAAYIQGWLKAIKNDKHLIVSAAGKAEKAVGYIIGNR